MNKFMYLLTLNLFFNTAYAEAMGERECVSRKTGLTYRISDDFVNKKDCFQVYKGRELLLSLDLDYSEYGEEGRVLKYSKDFVTAEVEDLTECGWFSCDYKFVVRSTDYPEMNDVLTKCRVIW